MDFTLDKLMQYKRTNVVAHMGLPPASFFERLVEIAGCPQNSCMSEAAWDLLVKPLYENRPTVADGNSKLAEIL